MRKDGKPETRGRKPAEFDYDKIEKLAAKGLTKEEIGLALGYKRTCFFDHKRTDAKIEEAIRRGRAKFKVFLSDILVAQAKKGNATAAIWLDKTRCGTKEDAGDNDQEAQPVSVTIQVVDASNKGTSEHPPGEIPKPAE